MGKTEHVPNVVGLSNDSCLSDSLRYPCLGGGSQLSHPEKWCAQQIWNDIPQTNITFENWWFQNELPFGAVLAYFQGRTVSFREFFPPLYYLPTTTPHNPDPRQRPSRATKRLLRHLSWHAKVPQLDHASESLLFGKRWKKKRGFNGMSRWKLGSMISKYVITFITYLYKRDILG